MIWLPIWSLLGGNDFVPHDAALWEENSVIQLFVQELNEAKSCNMLLILGSNASGQKM